MYFCGTKTDMKELFYLENWSELWVNQKEN